MKTANELSQLVAKTNDDDLRDIVYGWIADHPDFREYVGNCLCPPIEEIDFAHKLSQAVHRETKQFFSCHNVRTATDWRAVYYGLIMPWNDAAEGLSTARLSDLFFAIVAEVGMRITEEDFEGDDWYGDDFSGSIQDIMADLANIAGLLMIRDDLDIKTMDALRGLLENAEKTDIAGSYIFTPYSMILELVDLRRKAGEVSCGIFDSMINGNSSDGIGKWICRKIDFIRSMGLEEEALKYMKDEIGHPDVCLKYYEELMAEGDWLGSIELLDEAQRLEDNSKTRYTYPARPNWEDLKQQVLEQYGSLEERIEHLKRQFYNSNCHPKYFHKLKELVEGKNWRTFYHDLLSKASSWSDIGPLLIEEGEFDWLFRIVIEAVEKDPTDYHTPLKYAAALRQTHYNEMQIILKSAFKAYASINFPPKIRIKPSRFAALKTDLESLSAAGYTDTQKEIIQHLLSAYSTRLSLTSILGTIPIDE